MSFCLFNTLLSRSSLMSPNAGNWLPVLCQSGPRVKVLIAIKVIWLFLGSLSAHPSYVPLRELTFASCHRPPTMFLRLSSFTSITAHLQSITATTFHFHGCVGMSCPCWLSIWAFLLMTFSMCGIASERWMVIDLKATYLSFFPPEACDITCWLTFDFFQHFSSINLPTVWHFMALLLWFGVASCYGLILGVENQTQ